MGGVPEHDQIPQPVDQTQCGHNVRQIIPQQPCGNQGTQGFESLLFALFCVSCASTVSFYRQHKSSVR